MHLQRSQETVRRHRSSVATFAIVVAVTVAALPAQSAGRNIDAALVKLLADSEATAGRLQLTSSGCLGLERDRDPSNRLLRELRAIGLTFRKASACMEPPNGILLTLGPTTEPAADQLKVQVEITDMTIEKGSHFATILSRGIYTVAKDAKRAWTVVGHQALEVK